MFATDSPSVGVSAYRTMAVIRKKGNTKGYFQDWCLLTMLEVSNYRILHYCCHLGVLSSPDCFQQSRYVILEYIDGEMPHMGDASKVLVSVN
jgi:hypothetical protein